MSTLPPGAHLDQLRRLAKDRLKAARAGDRAALDWIGEVDSKLTLATAQLRLAREHGFASWPALQLEVQRRRLLDLRDARALSAFVAEHPELSKADLVHWRDHPVGASPLGYLAMARYDTANREWRDVRDTAAAAQVLIAAGAPVDGPPGARETPLITAASYGDAEIASVLIAAGADVDACASADAGGVPGGSALLHAAVFGMTDVLDLLVAAGAKVRSIEEAAAAGDLSAWPLGRASEQARVRALVMAADHERVDVIEALARAGTPIDEEDETYRRHPLRLAAAHGRAESVRCLLRLGADRTRRDRHGMTPLDHCRHGRAPAADASGHAEVERLLAGTPPVGD